MKTKSAKEKVTYCSLFFHPGMGISTQEVLPRDNGQGGQLKKIPTTNAVSIGSTLLVANDK